MCSISPRSCQLACSAAAQRDQDVVGLELLDGIRDDGQDAAANRRAADVGVDRAHVAQHAVEPLVGDMPMPIDIVRKPGESPGEGRA